MGCFCFSFPPFPFPFPFLMGHWYSPIICYYNGRGFNPNLLYSILFLCVNRHMLMIVDNEEFYEQEKPLALRDIRCLIIILRQVRTKKL